MGILGIGIIYFLSYYIISASPIRKDIFPLSRQVLKVVRHPPYQGGIKGGSAPPLLRGD
ncbi:hypothetical protein MICAB_550005 [Microcystis aeruginosa PCC 9717]|jgi:hypothetical protein|uniref:Uncharacterized protein n=1 Tax=Microcystis aeruginosa PCC 9717 TaxID=1160286 RepID=I4FTB4_MICAE|nr:hypothetical protein MICAB_550005 [Microcystis aeruginosa PCC 9717]